MIDRARIEGLQALLPDLHWERYGDDALVAREAHDGPLLARVRPPDAAASVWYAIGEAVPWTATVYPPGHHPCDGEGPDAASALRAAMDAAWTATARWRRIVAMFAPAKERR